MKKEPGINLQNPKKRELSPFLAKQLLYDYSVKNVDPLRERAVASALQDNPELAKSLDDILYGLSYCHHLSKTTLTPELLEQLKTPLNWKYRLQQLMNVRTWNKNAFWMLEAVFIGSLMLVAGLTLPWESYIAKFMKSQHPELVLSEVNRGGEVQKPVPISPPVEMNNTSFEYQQKAQLHSPNPGFTSNRLATALPRLGASIEHQSMRETDDEQVVPFLRISIPSSQTEALLSELGTHGQLTWLSAPAENEEEGAIFGMELWVLKEKPPEPVAPRPPSKDKKRK